MCKKPLKKLHKNVNVYVQCTQLTNLLAYNNPRQADMPLKSINHSLCMLLLLHFGLFPL